MERALLIDVDFKTGKRAGGINPKDRNLPCRGWQSLDTEPGKEIRLVMDDRDLSIYQGVPGVIILEGTEAINSAIVANIPVQYAVQSELLMLEAMKEKGLKLKDFAGKSMDKIAKEAYDSGIAGVVKRKLNLLE